MIVLSPIGFVRSERRQVKDDEWGTVTARIELTDEFDADALIGIDEFSHAEIIFQFDRVRQSEIEEGARHPRGNVSWPLVGIFAQRGKNRPNRLGVSIARIVSCQERVLTVIGLDAVDGTPVLDIKPVMAEFLPQGELRQPQWSHDLMRRYWQ